MTTFEEIIANNGLPQEDVEDSETTTGSFDGSNSFQMPDNITIRQPEILGGFIRNTEIDIKNTTGKNIFNVKRTGANVGDVTIGDYAGGQGILYDYSTNTLDIQGGVNVDELHIPDQTTANSFHTETDGDSWWGCNVADWASDIENAKAYILKNGDAKFEEVTTIGSSTKYVKWDKSELTLIAPILKTSTTGRRVEITGTNDNITVYDADDNLLFDVNTSGQPIARCILFDNTGEALRVQNTSGIVVGSAPITIFNIANASSTAPNIGLDNAGTGGHIRMTGDPSGANTLDGDLWFDGTDLKFKVGSTNHILTKTGANETITGTWAFSAFPTTPSSLPTTDYQVANKKYVDEGAWTVGNNIVQADSDEKRTTSETYVKLAEVELKRGGNVRVKYDVHCSGGAPDECKVKIYKNGVAEGTEYEVQDTTYVEKSEDISGVSKGDLIQVYGIKGTDSSCFVRRLRICVAEEERGANDVIEYVSLNEVGISSPSSASTWEDWDLSSYVPPEARYVDILVAEVSGTLRQAGIRNNHTYEYQKLVSLQRNGSYAQSVNLKCKITSQTIERYVSTVAANVKFSVVGYWH